MKRVARKAPAALQAFLDVDKQRTRLMGHIDQHLMTLPLDIERRQDVLHPSEMCSEDWCHRASWYLLSGAKPKEQKRNAAHLERIFAEGHLIHRKYQSWLRDMGVLYGAWKCSICYWIQWGQAGEADTYCKRCNGVVMEYAEVPLSSERHRIGGHADGWVVGLADPFAIEIKSVGAGTVRFEAPQLLTKHDNNLDEVWKDIRKPFRKHRLQGQLYMSLLEIMEEEGNLPKGAQRPNEMVYVYEYKPNQQTKEFVVAHDPASVEDLLGIALDIVFAVDKGTPVECNHGGCAKCAPFEESE